MTWDGSQQGPERPLGDGAAADDVVEQGGSRLRSLNWRPFKRRPFTWRPSTWPRRPSAAILLTAGVVAGLAVGYTAGDRQPPPGGSPPRPGTSSVPPAQSLAAGSPALTQGIGTCAVQDGRDLQLGVQVTNQSTASIALSLVHPVLPLGGLKWISQQWAPCSALPDGQDPAMLTPGASTWFSVTFEVLVRCPGPLPVQFTIDYLLNGRPAASSLPGFPDLGQVPYAGCANG
jgi:hypothetical protein